ncbi:hypothetical protein Tco_1048759, partial [Tanacetum coccineum]
WRGESWGGEKWCSTPGDGCVGDGWVGYGYDAAAVVLSGEDVIREGEVEGLITSSIVGNRATSWPENPLVGKIEFVPSRVRELDTYWAPRWVDQILHARAQNVVKMILFTFGNLDQSLKRETKSLNYGMPLIHIHI